MPKTRMTAPTMALLAVSILVATPLLVSAQTTNGNGSVEDRTSIDKWTAGVSSNGSGDQVAVAGPWEQGTPSSNGGGAAVVIGGAVAPGPTFGGPTPTPTNTPTDGPSPTPTNTPVDGATPTPTETCNVVDSDFDIVLNGIVDANDLLQLLTDLETGDENYDFNCDLSSDSLDLLLLAEKWRASVAP